MSAYEDMAAKHGRAWVQCFALLFATLVCAGVGLLLVTGPGPRDGLGAAVCFVVAWLFWQGTLEAGRRTARYGRELARLWEQERPLEPGEHELRRLRSQQRQT